MCQSYDKHVKGIYHIRGLVLHSHEMINVDQNMASRAGLGEEGRK